MLEKFNSRQRQTGIQGRNPFDEIDFHEVMSMGQSSYDMAKLEKLFANTELKIEEFFESRNNYYKNLQRNAFIVRTDADRVNEKKADRRGGGLAVKALAVEQKTLEAKVDENDKKI